MANEPESSLPSNGENSVGEEKQSETVPDTENVEKERYIEKLDKAAKKRLDYLLQQAEIYTHFLSNNGDTSNSKEQRPKERRPKHGNATKKRKLKYKSELEDNNNGEKSVYLTASPSFITGEMRNYQIDGLNWMVSLHDNGLNGILADDMGLGKTLQTVSLLGYMKHYKNIDGPHLVVAPLSTLVNWKREFERFCPSLNVFILAGVKEERGQLLKQKTRQSTWDVCITSFDICRIEQSGLRKIAWRYIVIDEAHRIKNEQALLSKAVRTFTSTNRLLLTGTPLQNDLHELWSLLNFLLPDVFDSAADFDKWFDPNVCLGDDDMVNRLHRILKPFMLRRIKGEVEKSLLPKIETKIFVGLSKLQREWYRKVLLKDITVLRNGFEATKMRLDNICMHLRKAANHPYLFEGAEEGPPFIEGEHLVQNSGKMIVLDKLLTKLKAQGSRVLIFSQFKILLNLLEDFCTLRKHEYYRLDGDTDYETRSANMEAFNAGNSSIFIFMISTRAGGLGITLTGADCVIVFDSDWNPQADLQAIDRAHRIGQTKQVRVFRLITKNTVDEKIVEVAERKMRLDRLVIQQGRMVDNKKLTAEEKMAIISHGANYVLSSTESDITDENIDKLLARSEIETAEIKSQLDKLGEGALQNFKIETPPIDSLSVFEGVDFRELRKGEENLVLDRMLRRKKPVQYTNSAVDKYNKWATLLEKNFRLYPKPDRISFLLDAEESGEISMAESRELQSLQKLGFNTWNEAQFKSYIDAVCTFGRDDIGNVSLNVKGKKPSEVIDYHKAFWERGPFLLQNFYQLKKRMERNDEYRQQRMALATASGAASNHAQSLYGSNNLPPNDENWVSSSSSFNCTSTSSYTTGSSDAEPKRKVLKPSIDSQMSPRNIYPPSSKIGGLTQAKSKPEWLSPFPIAKAESKLNAPTVLSMDSVQRDRPLLQPKVKTEWLAPMASTASSSAGRKDQTLLELGKKPERLASFKPAATAPKPTTSTGLAANDKAVGDFQPKRTGSTFKEPKMIDGVFIYD